MAQAFEGTEVRDRSLLRARPRVWWRRGAATAGALLVLVVAIGNHAAQGKTEAERKIALTADPGSLDPYRDNSVVGVQLQGHLYDQLVDFRGPDFTQTGAELSSHSRR